ncbi:MAG TPA: carbohydrate binding family 9 domain-containing protein, partial [Gemmatimonadales bacterium]|nr:carbohydrate binding family 9 domain-containing protein [Gemmatimonadales bacterium]
MIQRGWVLLFFACLVARKPAAAQERLTATVIIGGVQIDGRLTESFWESADSIWEFRQREPAQGAPCTERTVMKVARDRDALYVGVHAYDSDLRGIRATQLRRDADLSVDDEITLLIDSFHDRRSGFVFSTNPNGAMWDAQLTGVDEVDENWNGIWDVAVVRDTTGWTAEFRIPFRTLRFRSGGGSFGVNAQRFIRRKNEVALWRGWGRTEGLYRLIYEGEVGGFEDLHRGRNLEIKPYALGRMTAS